MQEKGEDLVRRLHAEEIERIRQNSPLPLLPSERPTIHWTELAELPRDCPIATEWNLYRREVGRLLAEGLEGKWVLIKGEQIIGIYESFQDAYQVALEKYLMQPVLIQQVRNREPILRVRGYNLLWRF
jgi:hypothetical protein